MYWCRIIWTSSLCSPDVINECVEHLDLYMYAIYYIFFNLSEMNFSVSSPRPTEKTWVFLCVYFFFLCGLTHRKISFNLGEHNFSVRARPTEKLFLTVNPQKNWIFLSLYFCGYFSEGTPSEKYFSDGIRIFPWVFAPSEKIEIPVVTSMNTHTHAHPSIMSTNLLIEEVMLRKSRCR